MIVMIKTLPKSRGIILMLFAALTVLAYCSNPPLPTCESPTISVKDLPISLRQRQVFNMHDIFSGYNLNITVPNMPSWVSVKPKIQKTDGKATSLSGLISYQMDLKGNQWDSSLVVLNVKDNSTIVSWGLSNTSSEIPNLGNKVVISTDNSIICFDAVWMRLEKIILVDCLKKITFGLQNIFYYVNSSTKEIINKVNNQMFINFYEIRHRKLSLQRIGGFSYLVRTYLAEGVDESNRKNTYVEIMSLIDPLKPRTIQIIDGAFLQLDQLSIMDFQIYWGNIYILDLKSGVFQLNFSQAEAKITGRYSTTSSFTRMGVYSGNHEGQLFLLLADQKRIVEIQWRDQGTPSDINYYSIPFNSIVHDLWLSKEYVVVQLLAVYTEDEGQKKVEQTFVMKRNSRTYLNAYLSVPQFAYPAFIDINRQTNQVLMLNEQGLSISKISAPWLNVMPTNPALLNQQISFIVKAQSSDDSVPKRTMVCAFTFKFIVLEVDKLALWPTGLEMPKDYYANYPGQLFIPVNRLVFGANVTYGIQAKSDQTIPSNYFLHQNQTAIIWYTKPPSMLKYNVLLAKQYGQQIFVYQQSERNITYFSRCLTVPYTSQMHCVQSINAPAINYRIANITASKFHYIGDKYLHRVAIVYDEYPNEVFVYDGDSVEIAMPPIDFPAGAKGAIQSVLFMQHYLVVVLEFAHTIVFFDMNRCEDYLPNKCQKAYQIDANAMEKMGISYFSPMDVRTSADYPFALFVQCLDRVIILDITKQGPTLLAQVSSPSTTEPGYYRWKMTITGQYLVIVNPPLVQEYDLNQLYSANIVTLNKNYPVYNYSIQEPIQIQSSSSGLVYITAIDKNLPVDNNAVVLVYKCGTPAEIVFYDVIPLSIAADSIILQVNGLETGDYVSVTHGSIYQMFREYKSALFVVENVTEDFKLNLTYTNDPLDRFSYLYPITIHSSYPKGQYILNEKTVSAKPDSLTFTVNSSNTSTTFSLNDVTWFNDSVLNYTLEGCDECNRKIKVLSHVQQERTFMQMGGIEDYAFSVEGGFVQTFESIIKMRNNCSFQYFIPLPSQVVGQVCTNIAYQKFYGYTLSVCRNQALSKKISIYATTYSSFKPFAMGPYYSSAQQVANVQIAEELIILVDVDQNIVDLGREGAVIVYAMNYDPLSSQLLDELQVINSNDLSHASGWSGGKVFIGNAYLSYLSQTGIYRLIITQMKNGIFITDFRQIRGRKSIQILKMTYINLAEELIRVNLPLPTKSYFTAVAVSKMAYDSTFKYWQAEVIVATSNFHSFLATLHIDIVGTVVGIQISRVFYRYAFYETINSIKTFDSYFAIGQKLPLPFDTLPQYSKTVLLVYDTRNQSTVEEISEKKVMVEQSFEATKVPVNFILGGYAMKRGNIQFQWNSTASSSGLDPLRDRKLLVLHDRDQSIKSLSSRDDLQIRCEEGIAYTQNGYLVARSDWQSFKIPFKLVVSQGKEGHEQYSMTLVSFFWIVLVIAIVFVLLWRNIKKKSEGESKENLLKESVDQFCSNEGEMCSKMIQKDSQKTVQRVCV